MILRGKPQSSSTFVGGAPLARNRTLRKVVLLCSAFPSVDDLDDCEGRRRTSTLTLSNAKAPQQFSFVHRSEQTGIFRVRVL